MSNIRISLFIGLVLFAKLGIKNSQCETIDCPNQPVTPYPVAPINPAQTICCPNQPLNLCIVSNPIATACCNSNQPISLCQPCVQNCLNNGRQCSNNTPCCSQSCCYCQSSCQSATTQMPPVTTAPTQPPITATTTLPPEALVKCPPGTLLIGKICHLIYCPRGSIMQNGRCVVIECPEGTVWTGHRCSVPEPIVQNLTFYNTVITQFNQSKPNIILNNTNNIIVNVSLTLQEENNCNNDYGDCDEPMPLSTTSSPLNCCNVTTPRICEERQNRWYCYSRRYHRCGDFCITPTIYLRPPRIYSRPKYVIMPPIQHDCQLNGNCGPISGGHDCSGCAMNNMEECSYYCYRYSCPSRKCNFYDQQKYCSYYAGSNGCLQKDGCYDDWCN